MKLFIYDRGWPGAVIVVAESAEQAAQIFNSIAPTDRLWSGDIKAAFLTEYPLTLGTVVETYGDR